MKSQNNRKYYRFTSSVNKLINIYYRIRKVIINRSEKKDVLSQKLTAYTLFTDTHKKLFYEYFIKSFPFESNLELVIRNISQEYCYTGEWRSVGWIGMMRQKIDYILEIINHTPKNSYFVFTDVDVQFFRPIKQDLINQIGENDIACQLDSDDGQYCAGFYIARANKRVKRFFKKIQDNLEKFPGEQPAFNHYIRKMDIKSVYLDSKYFTVGVRNGHWEGSEEIVVPDNISVHHANWTIGVDNKIKLMDTVRNIIIHNSKHN